MESVYNPDLYDLAITQVSVKWNKSSDSYSFYVHNCNNTFTKLTGLKADSKQDVGEVSFGNKQKEYLMDLYNFQENQYDGELILRFHTTKKWLLFKIKSGESHVLNCSCIDITAIQRKLNAFNLQKIGYSQYIDNFHGLAFQRLLKPVKQSVFTAGAYEEITGYTSEQAENIDSWLEIIHPDDRERIEQAAAVLYEQSGYKKELEYRIIKKDGEVRWIHSYDSNFLSDDGNMQMVQGLIVDVTNQKEIEIKLQEANKKILEQNKKLETMSMTDHLTGLSNRRSIQQVLEYFVNNYKRTGEQFSLFMIDLDNFKEINDKYGHDGGDAVLCGISDILKNQLRNVDLKSRWGGEEFLIVLPHTNMVEANQIALKLLEKVRKSIFEYKNIDIHVTFSGGVATYDKNISIQTIIKKADRALYEAKESGRNKIVLAK